MRLDFVNVKIFWHGDSNETIFLIFVNSVEPNLSIKRESKLYVKYIEDSSLIDEKCENINDIIIHPVCIHILIFLMHGGNIFL